LGASKQLQVAPADVHPAPWLGAIIGEGAPSDGPADGLGVPAQEGSDLLDGDLTVQVLLGRGDQLLE
jgi:hypothetical protein